MANWTNKKTRSGRNNFYSRRKRRGQERTLEGIKGGRERCPILWTEIHPDNDTSFLNWHLYKYAQQEKLEFSRSRPYKKNDNCLVGQKNKTHIRKHVGHLRYDTEKELKILQSLYRNELRLFKNFFQPQIKLISKERIKSRIHRKYDKAKTPYKRIMEDTNITKEVKQKLTQVYQSLNPVELMKNINHKLDLLYKAHENKSKGQELNIKEEIKLVSVRNLITQPELVSVR